MNELERFESLARAARAEPAARLDVAARVHARIRRIETGRQATAVAALWVMSGLSVLAASVAIAAVAYSEALPWDPAAALFSPLTMVML